MHVLPLPFGLALALLPRREADRLRPKPEPHHIQKPLIRRERVLEDMRYFRYV